jgi:phage shock protein PspC (stress-responsive transcriptional regulator)
MNWKKKLSSRKLWAAIVGVVVGIAAAFGLDESEWVQIAGVVTSAASVVAYIFGESKIDAAASVPIIIPDVEKENPKESQDDCL